MISKVRSFSLKQRDFASGKMVSPPRSEWVSCDCCGKAIVQGAVLSNGHRIGNDCEEVRWRAAMGGDMAATYRMFGTPKRIQDYMNAAILGVAA